VSGAPVSCICGSSFLIVDDSHEWMFVTDTTDAVYPPETWSPYAIMDRLSEILSRTALVSTTAFVCIRGNRVLN
jgi:hypothetical protein